MFGILCLRIVGGLFCLSLYLYEKSSRDFHIALFVPNPSSKQVLLKTEIILIPETISIFTILNILYEIQ